jgi:hypothetical protein
LVNSGFDLYSYFFIKFKKFRSLEELKRDAKNISFDLKALQIFLHKNKNNLIKGKDSEQFETMQRIAIKLKQQFFDLSLSPTYRYFFWSLFMMSTLGIAGWQLEFLSEFLLHHFSFLSEHIKINYLLDSPKELDVHIFHTIQSIQVLEDHLVTFFEPDSTLLTEEDKVYIRNEEKQNIEVERFSKDDIKQNIESEKTKEQETTAPLGWVVVTVVVVGCLYLLSQLTK